MSASPSPTPSTRDELMFLGTACHHRACNLHDFLPFYCPACKKAFCQPHFLPSSHECTAPLPPSMVDRIAPQCPMCDHVVNYAQGSMDPNVAVERHILSGTCTGVEGGQARKKALLRQRKDKGEVCYRRGCTKVLVVPMRCDACAHSFCPPHRHAPAHSCTATPASSRSGTPVAKPTSTPAGKSAMSRLLGNQTKPSPKLADPPAAKPQPATAQVEARAAAAAAAMKRAGQDVKVPFIKSKDEKRANDEMQSTIKSLKTRHDKGLLTPTEEVRG